MDLLRRRYESKRPWIAVASAFACGALVVASAPDVRAQAAPPPASPPPTAAAAPPPPEVVPPPGSPPLPYGYRPYVISDWPEDEPPPPGYHWGKRVRRGPIIAGSVLFGTFYSTSLLVGAVGQDAGDPAYEWLYVPGIGPFIELTNSSSAVASVFLILDGAAQSAGLALLIWGIVSPAPILVSNVAEAPRVPKVLPVPMLLGKSGEGLGLLGTF